MNTRHPCSRRDFLRTAGAAAAAAACTPALSPAAAPKKEPDTRSETMVKTLFESLDERQRKQVCFDWDHVDKKRGLLRTRIENNWRITKPTIEGKFFSKDQQEMIRQSFRGITHPDWHGRFDQQWKDDRGGCGKKHITHMANGAVGHHLFHIGLGDGSKRAIED